MPTGTILIGGSTASGKSALALALAERTGGVIVNADSVQLYRDLPILTARPGHSDLARAEHRLYGILDAHETASVALWLAKVEPLLGEIEASGRLALVTGGTGLYFKALLEGLPAIPDIPSSLRAELRRNSAPAADLHAQLARSTRPWPAASSPAIGNAFCAGSRWCTPPVGRSAPGRRTRRGRLVVPQPVVGLALLPPAEIVDPRIAARLEAMLEAGLLAELEAFRTRKGQAPTPLAKADGVAELGAYLDGTWDLETRPGGHDPQGPPLRQAAADLLQGPAGRIAGAFGHDRRRRFGTGAGRGPAGPARAIARSRSTRLIPLLPASTFQSLLPTRQRDTVREHKPPIERPSLHTTGV